MELLVSDSHYILVDDRESLWISRQNNGNEGSSISFEVRNEDHDELMRGGFCLCLGTVYGFIGKLHYNESSEPRLVFIQRRSKVGEIKGKDLFRISSIICVPLESETELLLEPCTKCCRRQTNTNSNTNTTMGMGNVPVAVPSMPMGGGIPPKTKAFTSIEPVQSLPGGSGGSLSLNLNNSSNNLGSPNQNNSSSTALLTKVRTPTAGSKIASSSSTSFSSLPKKLERSDKIEDEFLKMFTEAESFFYSTSYDITNTAQRTFFASEKLPKDTELPMWKRADSRFFWNIHLMSDLIDAKDPSLDKWILPIVQGYIQHETCDVSQFEVLGPEISGQIEICIISRRSRHRAGTRYIKRGVDENGKVANYVETEQILMFKGHIISFVQIRGSIPVFWSQPGYKYRPPPVLERSEEENFQAFSKHFQEEESIYGPLTVINLVEKGYGRKEKVLGDAYLENILKYDSPNINYFAYDFHENCRGMRFENVAKLVDKLQNVLKNMNYCWLDSYGLVLKQEGVCRVNCIDCLDRTNVVQTNISKHMLIVQLSKLGLLTPEITLPNNIKSKLQIIYANNGDTISKQYAGTNALKGDFTRTGERRLAGMMKDGMNSANRYYLNRFKDTSRQAAIDVILGVKTNITEDDLDGEKPLHDEKENTAEQIKQVIDDVKKTLIPTSDVILGSWGLVNATNEPDTMDIDIIFILTSKCYYVTEYDCVLDALTETQKIPLNCIENIEIGYEPMNTTSSNLWSIFQSSNASNSGISPKGIPCIRLNYEISGQSSYHQFRSSNVRFFNNTIITVNHNPDEMLEALKMLGEAVESAASISGKNIVITEVAYLPVKETPRGNNSSSWVHRYFSFGTDGEGNDKTNSSNSVAGSEGSIGQGSPTKFYRRGSLISTPSQGDSGIESQSEVITSGQNGKKKIKGDGDTILGAGEITELSESDIQISFLKTYGDVNKFQTRTPVEGFKNFLVSSSTKDLVLPSCGILSVHENNFSSSLQALLCAHELIVDVDGLGSPVTPTVDHEYCPVNYSQTMNQHQQNSEDDHHHHHHQQSPSKQLSPTLSNMKNGNILSRHRHSLPVNSLTMGVRPITPEITITEEEPSSSSTGAAQELKADPASSSSSQQQQQKSNTGNNNNSNNNKSSSSKLNVIPKRMTRSSEDVNKIAASPSASSPVNPHSFVSKLSSTFGGVSAGVGHFNLKLSRFSPTSSSSSSTAVPLSVPMSSDNRASSDLDLFGSTSNKSNNNNMNMNMKESHSENILRDSPFQNQGTNRKDLVLAPFNKFAKGMQFIGNKSANYLDPRKLKGVSFKQPRIDNIKIIPTSSKQRDEQNKKELVILQERIKNCKSLIVDV